MPLNGPQLFEELSPAPRLLMGPGPVNVYPSVLSALSMPVLGRFDPRFTESMNRVMALTRQVFRTENHWAFLVDGAARHRRPGHRGGLPRRRPIGRGAAMPGETG